jgi:hypothetical protein
VQSILATCDKDFASISHLIARYGRSFALLLKLSILQYLFICIGRCWCYPAEHKTDCARIVEENVSYLC